MANQDRAAAQEESARTQLHVMRLYEENVELRTRIKELEEAEEEFGGAMGDAAEEVRFPLPGVVLNPSTTAAERVSRRGRGWLVWAA